MSLRPGQEESFVKIVPVKSEYPIVHGRLVLRNDDRGSKPLGRFYQIRYIPHFIVFKMCNWQKRQKINIENYDDVAFNGIFLSAHCKLIAPG